MKVKDWVFGVGIVLAIVVGVNFPLNGQTVTERVVEKLGAAPGGDFPGPCTSVAGLRTCSEQKRLSVATTTNCAIQSPDATSSLRAWGIGMSVSSTSASVVTMAKATTPFATTTLLGAQVAIAANASAYIVGSTTATQQTAGADLFAPRTWLVFGMQGGTGTFSPTGTCFAEWKAFN